MAKITRATQQIFGSSATTGQIAQFGSLAAGTPTFTTSPTTIQALSNYLQGWFGAVVGPNSPAIEDMNALCYLYAYQLAYLLQEGVPEWDSGTTYYAGSIVQDGNGNLYTSITNSNLNNALTSTANWLKYTGSVNIVPITSSSSPYTMSAADNGKLFYLNTSTGAFIFNLPNPSVVGANFEFTVKDVGGTLSLNSCTFHRFGTEKFELLQSDYVAQANGGEWFIATNGTDWNIVGR